MRNDLSRDHEVVLEFLRQSFSLDNFQSSVKFTKGAFKISASFFFSLDILYSSVFLDRKCHYLMAFDRVIYGI